MMPTESVRLPDLITRYQLEQAKSAAFDRAQVLAQIYHSTALDGLAMTPTQVDSLLQT